MSISDKHSEISAKTLQQIEALKIKPGQPVIISDADEVLVHFARPLESFLDNQGLYIDLSSYKLFGNVRQQKGDHPVAKEDVYKLLGQFFDTHVHTCPPVDGAAGALSRLSAQYQVVILTNTPINARDKRARSLAEHGMDYPVIANEGHKGAAVQLIAQKAGERAVFLDDIPHHHTSVLEHAPDVHRLHFVADPRLSALLPKAEHAHKRLNSWAEIEGHITALFQG